MSMDKNEMTELVYKQLHAKVEWDKLTQSVLCEMYTSRLFADVVEFRDRLDEVGEQLPDAVVVRVEAQIEAYIRLMVDLTEVAIGLFLAEGFTEQEQIDYYPKEGGDYGEDLEEGA